ncbi:unnamed protein product [Zymoseptoria tritici ST99CH_1E4]|uniref:HTH CENPB-type domain-containing protein n=1 Tax=Zymoseptoria tritici ST99CH_1E4 TaxID=1276532 RepID=A0A2H1G4X3_ZYMTR|nr:unnamed protein product [Zymoseptoria tritici ST99CH_1E4]SMR62258.1 unnamed protein product [Zymoseptoria tritici ST99CH_1E4]
MAPMDDALEELTDAKVKNIQKIATKHKVHRSTLSRRWRKLTDSRARRDENNSILSHQQERTLVAYIDTLTRRGIPPTPAMVLTFVHDIAKVLPDRKWVPRFVKRHRKDIDSRYLKPLDKHRKKADSARQFKAYYDLLARKIEQYNIEPCNTYNMDEKGFLIGMLQKTRRIFTKKHYLSERLIGNMQDGSREWITLIATICADGTCLPPALIYKAVTGNIQSSWLQDFEPDDHCAFFASSPNGWTDHNLGLHWLQKVFEPFTRDKAGKRGYRLLVIDGHGSHVNMAFLQYCMDHRIFVAVYPPHSTHRLQPLDVSLFGPLANLYSSELSRFIQQTEGLSAVTKRDFFRLFWPAYKKAFTPANIASGFRKTGLYPLDPAVVLKKLEEPAIEKTKHVHFSDGSRPGTANDFDSRPSTGRPTTAGTDTSVISNNWRETRALMRSVLKKPENEKERRAIQKLTNTFIHTQTQNQLLKSECTGLRDSFKNEQKKRQRGKPLLSIPQDQAAQFYSPAKLQASKELMATKEAEKVTKKQQKEANAIKKKVDEQLRAEQRIQAKVDRQAKALQKKAEKALLLETKKANSQLNTDLRASARTASPAKRCRRKAVVDKPVLIVVLKVPSLQRRGAQAAESSQPPTRMTLRQKLQAAQS